MPGWWNNDSRGSTTVFLSIALAGMVLVASILFIGAKSSAGKSAADAALQLAGRSILSEYDRRLLSDYGLLAFRGDEAAIEGDAAYYANATLDPKSPAYALYRSGGDKIRGLNTKATSVTVNLKEYSLLDLGNFEDQLKSAYLAGAVKNLAGRKGGGSPGAADTRDRTLRRESIIASLPSNGYDAPFFPILDDIGDLPDLTQVLSAGASTSIANEYALTVFSNKFDGTAESDRFFSNEVEYIVAGRYGDESNYSSVKTRISAIRFILNNISIAKDPVRQAKIEKVALAVAAATEGLGEEPARLFCTEAWVAAETRNDIMLLESGRKVPFFKTTSQWATENLEEIMDGIFSDTPVLPSGSGGQSYTDYLRILLFMTDRETKLLRIMDLMQINLKGGYYKEFLMREYYTGFRLTAEVDGDEFSYVQKY
ncbi:MAG: DUF5702 domain-containing protein [Clostridiales Family XIII bacterium]|jgi:hypothetical protein|nr:DUF5702 domain-containing protein [Clostridiales Family XIII bacterium]